MKGIVLSFLLCFCGNVFFSQTITAAQAAKHEGETVTVCAKVVGTFITKGDKKVIYLNLEKPFPNNPFTVVIFEKSAENFDYNPIEFLKGKNICVTGKVTMYKDKPQIIANKQEQIKIN